MDNALALTQAAAAFAEEVSATPREGALVPWREPDLSILSTHREAAPQLPPVFGEFWCKWIVDAAESKGAPPDFVAVALLSAAGALVANHRRARPWPGWDEAPILWAALVGNPSSGK